MKVSQRCTDVFIIKIAFNESLTGFVRSYNLNKYGIFTISYDQPVTDYTFFQNNEIDFCALVLSDRDSVFDLKRATNPKPFVSFEPILISRQLSPPYDFYGNIWSYVQPQDGYNLNPILVTYEEAIQGFTFKKPGSTTQISFPPNYAIEQSKYTVTYQINRTDPETEYSAFIDKSPDLIHAMFFEPFKDYASKYLKRISYGDLVMIVNKQELNRQESKMLVLFITGIDGVRKLAITVPLYLSPGFYFIKGLGRTDFDYFILYIQ